MTTDWRELHYRMKRSPEALDTACKVLSRERFSETESKRKIRMHDVYLGFIVDIPQLPFASIKLYWSWAGLISSGYLSPLELSVAGSWFTDNDINLLSNQVFREARRLRGHLENVQRAWCLSSRFLGRVLMTRPLLLEISVVAGYDWPFQGLKHTTSIGQRDR